MSRPLVKLCIKTYKLCWSNVHLTGTRCSYSITPFKAKDHTFVRKYEDTFQVWVLKMFENNDRFAVLRCDKNDIPAINEQNKHDIESLLNILRAKKKEETLTPNILRKIDSEIDARISAKSSLKQLLGCLHALLTTVPIQSSGLSSYKSAITHVENKLKKTTVSTPQLIQAMYYASQLKTRSEAQKFVSLAVRKFDVDDFKSICTNDMGIFCIASFRCSVPIDRPAILKCLHERFTKDINSLILDNQSIFVSMVKCFRLSKYHDKDLVHFIASQGVDKLSNLDIVAKIHLAVYFAVFLYGDVNFISSYYKLCIRQLSDKISIEKSPPRLKEFDNLLWSCASFNLEEVNEEIANSKLPEYVSESLCLLRRDLDSIIALLSSLWICGIRLEKDIVRYVTAENVQVLKDSPNFKSRAILYQLLTCVHLESPDLLKPSIIQVRDNRLQPKYETYINKRPQLKKLLKQLQDFGQSLGLKNIRFSFEVPALYIGGISAEYNGSPISLEVADQKVCLTDSSHLNGRMKLKLRLLERMGRKFVLVPGSDSYTPEDLRRLLVQNCQDDNR